jgi:arylsulfatase A-like enzyme
VPSKPFAGRSPIGLYGDFVTECDAQIGRILAAAEARGSARDTLIIVTSDNGSPWSAPDIEATGGHRANMLWRGQKADIYEAGHRVPFLVRDSRVKKRGEVSTATVCLTDIFATCAEAAGVPLPTDAAEDSFSVLPAVRGGKTARPHIVHHSGDGHFAIRQGDWKLAMQHGSGGFTLPKREPERTGGTLFNLKNDPFEKDDLYAKQPAKVDELTKLLASVQEGGRSR